MWLFVWENEPKEIFIWEWKLQNNLDRRWPAPEWFHIPTRSEWVAVHWVLTSTFWLDQNDTTAKTYLKMPLAGYREGTSSNIKNVDVGGHYLTCTPYQTYRAWIVYINSTMFDPGYTIGRAFWYSIRCFKNDPVIPNSNWTTLYDWSSIATWAWVFHNASLWLISISWDGNTWYTIADKNLWATTVYNNWNTLSQANCWYYYQWWNNYWFAWTGTIQTTTSQANAWYNWPWNYYNGSTFIVRSSAPYDWTGVQNDNLRWWIDSIWNVKKVYMWSTKIWPSTKPWIYWNQQLWLISASSDWTNWITMADKNLWATTVYNYWDTMTQANCWNFYQRWNNYAFPYTWSVSSSFTTVDVSSYWPTNYYSNSTFRKVNYEWTWRTSGSATAALNLRWDVSNTNESRRWPCPEWFHIPSHDEGVIVSDIPRDLFRMDWSDKYKIYKMPLMWFRDNYSTQMRDQWTDWTWWTSTIADSDAAWGVFWSLYLVAFGAAIRPFKNIPVVPDDSWIPLSI